MKQISLKCPDCSEVFHNKNNLIEHMKDEHGKNIKFVSNQAALKTLTKTPNKSNQASVIESVKTLIKPPNPSGNRGRQPKFLSPKSPKFQISEIKETAKPKIKIIDLKQFNQKKNPSASEDPFCPLCNLRFLSDSDLEKHNDHFHSVEVK